MIVVRDMQETDIEAVSTVRVRSWKAAYVGMVPADYLDGLAVETDVVARRRMFLGSAGVVDNFVAEVDGSVVGWAVLGPSREDDAVPGDGELYAIYVLPEMFGSGTGQALMRAVRIRAAERSFERIVLWVIRDNVRGRRFYEAAGFVADGGEDDWVADGVAVPEVRYRAVVEPGDGESER